MDDTMGVSIHHYRAERLGHSLVKAYANENDAV